MENGSTTRKYFELLGLEEMERLRYFYFPLLSVIYLCILMLSIVIVYVVTTNQSLHQPMYILISNLMLNGVVGSSSFFPKLLTDLWTSSKTISHDGCKTQSAFITAYACFELLTFSTMAYDRYLAVCHPLHYPVIMTNATLIKLLLSCSVVLFFLILTNTFLIIRLSLCGTEIKNIFCDNMSIVILACTDTSVNNIYEMIVTIVLLGVTILISIFSYVRIYIICLRIPKESRQKALHTLVSQMINFSVFLLGFLFVVIRHRLGSSNLPIRAHVGLSMPSLVFPPLINPLLFGVRTKVLKSKMVHLLKRWRTSTPNEN